MRVLVTWGSKMGGTEGIARLIAATLRDNGFDVDLRPARAALGARGFDAAIVGGALYAGRWHPDARRFVDRRARDLRAVPTWLFSSGPLDDSASLRAIPPTRQVRARMDRVGALGHTTFGGRLPADARGFPARAMARTHAGDWRDPERIHAWATEVAHALPTARPGVAVPQPARSIPRLVEHAVAGWALCAVVMGTLLTLAPPTVAFALHAIAAPLIFAAVAWSYFRPPAAREPLPTALAFTAIVALLDFAIVAGLVLQSFKLFASVAGTWLPLALIFLATFATAEALSFVPPPAARPAR